MSSITDTDTTLVARERNRSRGAGLTSWLMVGPAVVFLAFFLLAPLWYVFQYSVGLRTFAKTKALASVAGELTSFSGELWRAFLKQDVQVHVAGLGAIVTTSSLIVAIALALLIAGTLLGLRLFGPAAGPWVTAACAVLLLLPFLTVPWQESSLRLAELHPIGADSTYLRLFFKSISMAMTSSVFAVLFAFPVAYYMAFVLGRSKYTWILIVITPFLTSYLLRVFAWSIVLGDQGLVNTVLVDIGISRQTWLLDTQFTVMVVLTYAWVPFICLPIFIALENIDRRLLEAATDLGASRVKAFFKVTLPLAAPGTVAAFLFVFIPSIGEYVTPSLVGGTNGYMYGNAIVTQFVGGALSWQEGSVLALFLVVVVLVLTGATSRFLRAGGGAT